MNIDFGSFLEFPGIFISIGIGCLIVSIIVILIVYISENRVPNISVSDLSGEYKSEVPRVDYPRNNINNENNLRNITPNNNQNETAINNIKEQEKQENNNINNINNTNNTNNINQTIIPNNNIIKENNEQNNEDEVELL